MVANGDATRQTGYPRRRLARLLPAIIPLGVGAFVGYGTAYQASQPGFAALDAILYLALAILVAGILTVVGLIALVWAGGRAKAGGRVALATAGLLAIGYAVGAAVVPTLGLGYRVPVTLYADGTATLQLAGGLRLETAGSVSARCSSMPDSTEVEVVSAAFGAVGRGTLLGTVTRTGPDTASVTLTYLEAGAPPQESEWTATGRRLALADGGMSGQLAFVNAVIATARSSPSQPVTVSGELVWSCEPWQSADASPTEPPPPAEATVDVELLGLGWLPGAGEGTCEAAGDGSVRTVGYVTGRLNDQPMSIWVDLPFGQRYAGQVVQISIQINGQLPGVAPGVPAWEGSAELAEVGAMNKSGRLAFADLPARDTEANEQGPWPEGWPRTLAGSMRWVCAEPPPPPSEATIELALNDVDWEQLASTGRCDLSTDGTVEYVSAGMGSGKLNGWLAAFSVDLSSGQGQVGDAPRFFVTLFDSDRGHLSGWAGTAILDEVAAMNRSGAATFDDLPATDTVALGFGPWPTDLPLSLAGRVRWKC